MNKKYILIVRHGEVNNPKNIVYNRDELMASGDLIHLSKEGRKQMSLVAKLIKRIGFQVVAMIVSDQKRTWESALAINKILKIDKLVKNPKIKDVRGIGPYKEGLTMDQWREMKGNAYDEKRWGLYHHEKPEEVIRRMDKVFNKTIKELKAGETAILISHGDPIAWFVNWKLTHRIPNPKELRDLIYPTKGGVIVAIIDPSGKLFTVYELTDDSLKKGSLY